jgi:Lon protease (S16) C-terminal proteolytic domain
LLSKSHAIVTARMSENHPPQFEQLIDCSLCRRSVPTSQIGLRGRLNFCQTCANERATECLIRLGAKKNGTRQKRVLVTALALGLIIGAAYVAKRRYFEDDPRLLVPAGKSQSPDPLPMPDKPTPVEPKADSLPSAVAKTAEPWLEKVFGNKDRNSVKDVGQIHLLFVMRPGTDSRMGLSSRLFITREAPTNVSAQLVTDVGKDMQISFDEGLRYVRKQPRDWERDFAIRLSFEDKFMSKDGGSAGAGFTIGMLAAMQGFALDPDVAVTGDFTIDGTIQPVGAVVEKLRGAIEEKCKITLIPERNSRDVADLAILSGTPLLWETQIFSIATIDQAVGLARLDRTPAIRNAIARFATLRARLPATVTDNYLPSPIVQAELKEVLKLAPNHLSAATLLQAAENQLPHELSLNRSVEEIIANSYFFVSDVIASEPGKSKRKSTDGMGITVFPEREYNACCAELHRLTPMLDRRSLDLKSACLAYVGAVRGVWTYQKPDTSIRRTPKEWVALAAQERNFQLQAKTQMDETRSRVILALRKLDTDGSLMSEMRKK